MSNIPSLTLNTNASMPLLGLGVYKATAPGEVEALSPPPWILAIG